MPQPSKILILQATNTGVGEERAQSITWWLRCANRCQLNALLLQVLESDASVIYVGYPYDGLFLRTSLPLTLQPSSDGRAGMKQASISITSWRITSTLCDQIFPQSLFWKKCPHCHLHDILVPEYVIMPPGISEVGFASRFLEMGGNYSDFLGWIICTPTLKNSPCTVVESKTFFLFGCSLYHLSCPQSEGLFQNYGLGTVQLGGWRCSLKNFNDVAALLNTPLGGCLINVNDRYVSLTKDYFTPRRIY